MSKQKIAHKIVLEIKVTTNSSITRFKKKAFPILEIALNAIPEKGKANEELINFLSKELKLPKSRIEITKGLSSRLKTVILNIELDEEAKMIEKLKDV